MNDCNNFQDFPKEIKTPTDSSNPLADIIANIQEKLYSNSSTSNATTYQKSNHNNNITFSDNNNIADFNISNFFQTLTSLGVNNKSNNIQNNSNNETLNGLNIETLMRFSKILNGFNQNDPRKNLLNSLKPFLRDTRKKNIDTYIFALGILNILDNFSKEDSGNNGI